MELVANHQHAGCKTPANATIDGRDQPLSGPLPNADLEPAVLSENSG